MRAKITREDGSILEARVSSHDLALLALYAQFSEDSYAAGWLTCDENLAGRFESYLSSLLAGSEPGTAEMEEYEFEALPLLRRAALRAGFGEDESGESSRLAEMIFARSRYASDTI